MNAPDTDYDLDKVLDTHRFGGGMLRDKAKALLEDWLVELYPRMKSKETPTTQLLDIGRVLIDLGGMKSPPPQVTAPTGPAFSITISLPSPSGGQPVTIQGHVVQPEAPLVDIDFSKPTPMAPIDYTSLPPIPDHLRFVEVDNSALKQEPTE